MNKMQNIGEKLSDFEIFEEKDDYIKVCSKRNSKFYFLRKYQGLNLNNEKTKLVNTTLRNIQYITNLKYFGLFKEENSTYLIFEYFHGKRIKKEVFKPYHIYHVALLILNIFEKLNEIKLRISSKNTFDVFIIGLSEIKINCFDIIINQYNIKGNEIYEMAYNLSSIMSNMERANSYITGFIGDLRRNKYSLQNIKNNLIMLKKYSLYCRYYSYDVIDYRGMIYSGILDKGKPNIGGALYNEYGNVYMGGFENGEMNGEGEYTEYSDNSKKIYVGKFLKGKKHGNGVEKYYFILTKYGNQYNHTNFIYKGEFKNGKYDGKGILYDFKDEDNYKIYEGEFKNGKYDGKGIYYMKNIIIYQGQFKDGKFHGKGVKYNDKEYGSHYIIYEGYFLNDLYNGEGRLYYESGLIQYIGNFKDGEFNGKGVYYDKNNKKYDVIDGLPENDGIFIKYNNSNGHYYELNIENKKIVGKIKEYNNDNLIYYGEFKNNKYNGYGILYNYGSKNYEGYFIDKEYDGKGIEYYYKEKIKYNGDFKKGKYHGKGIKYKEDGKIEYNGTFENGEFIEGFQSTDEYEGDIIKKKKIGKGKLYINDSLRFEGEFNNDIFIKGIVYDKNRKKFFDGTIDENNKIQGNFYVKNKIIFTGKFEDYKELSNYIVEFNNKCKIIYEGEYKNGMRCGIGEDYEGKYEGEFLYDLYYGEGQINYNNGEFKNGQKTGKWGNSNYKNGKKNGKSKGWYYSEEYVDDYLHGEKSGDGLKEIYYFGEKSDILNTVIKNNCIYFNDIKEYEGELSEDNKKNGKGIEFYKNGNKRYEGMFINGKHSGEGIEYFENGNIKYKGEYDNNGEYSGYGIEYEENKKEQIIYKGNFLGGKYHGKGKLFRYGKIVYEGDFVENRLEGEGKEFDKNGDVVYIGEFRNNSYNGKGTKFNLRDKTKIEGIWENNRQNKFKESINKALTFINKKLKLNN